MYRSLIIKIMSRLTFAIISLVLVIYFPNSGIESSWVIILIYILIVSIIFFTIYALIAFKEYRDLEKKPKRRRQYRKR